MKLDRATGTDRKLSAVVFLRARKSVRQLASGPLPEDLEAYRAPQDVRDRVQHVFESLGFDVYSGPADLTLHLSGTDSVFEACFGEGNHRPGAEMEPPAEAKPFIEAVVLTKRPELT